MEFEVAAAIPFTGCRDQDSQQGRVHSVELLLGQAGKGQGREGQEVAVACPRDGETWPTSLRPTICPGSLGEKKASTRPREQQVPGWPWA